MYSTAVACISRETSYSCILLFFSCSSVLLLGQTLCNVLQKGIRTTGVTTRRNMASTWPVCGAQCPIRCESECHSTSAYSVCAPDPSRVHPPHPISSPAAASRDARERPIVLSIVALSIVLASAGGLLAPWTSSSWIVTILVSTAEVT